MALPKKARYIEVEGHGFRWMVAKGDGSPTIAVYIQQASGNGPRLRITMPLEGTWTPNPSATGGHEFCQTTSVTPATIKKRIKAALDMGWQPDTPGDMPPALAHLTQSNETSATSWQQHFGTQTETLQKAWAACTYPPSMLSYLIDTNQRQALLEILKHFAFPMGLVADLLSLEPIQLATSGWKAHQDGSIELLSPDEKMRSIRQDVLYAQTSALQASVHDFYIHMIEACDIGTHGHLPTYQKFVADVIRSVVPTPEA